VSFVVRYSASARDDLTRLYEYLLDQATTAEDLDLAEQALGVIVSAVEGLSRSPFIYRKAGADPFLREMLIPFGGSGYVALFEVEDASTVTILAVRHQLEDDYH
jgi:plasmid stabilization system protein ParE